VANLWWFLLGISAAEWETGGDVSGTNDFQRVGYKGPCPPCGDHPHRYVFTLYALELLSLRLTSCASRTVVEQAMQQHILDQTRLIGRYGRSSSARPAGARKQ
jgi:Raf kinase inhibitor-like YbhB/YbcL family protein